MPHDVIIYEIASQAAGIGKAADPNRDAFDAACAQFVTDGFKPLGNIMYCLDDKAWLRYFFKPIKELE